MEALNSQVVLEDTKITIGCITQHPGFAPLCLNKWVLRQAAGKYRRIDGRSYSIARSEEAYASFWCTDLHMSTKVKISKYYTVYKFRCWIELFKTYLRVKKRIAV